MAGSVDNPVRLGPFRRIVEVGWPSGWYAFRVAIIDEFRTAEATACSPSIGGDSGNPSNYMTSSRMEIQVGSTVRYKEGDGAWESVTPTVTFENDPAAPFENSFSDGTAQDVYSADGPHRLALSGGSALPDAPPPPNNPSGSFVSDTDILYEVIGRPIDASGAECRTIAFVGDFFQYPPTGDYGAVTSPASIGVADVVMSIGGRQYTPVGAYLVPDTKGANPTVEVSAPILAWVLCQRSDVTA